MLMQKQSTGEPEIKKKAIRRRQRADKPNEVRFVCVRQIRGWSGPEGSNGPSVPRLAGGPDGREEI